MIAVNAHSLIYSLRHMLMPQTKRNEKPILINDGPTAGRMHPSYCAKRGLIFNFDISVSHRDSVTNGLQKRMLVHVMVAGHSDAFVAVRDFTNRLFPTWENVGNHDSCWIDSIDTKLSSIYFKMCEEVSPDTAPRDLNQQTFLSAFGDAVQMVEVVTAPDENRNKEHGCNVWKRIVKYNAITHEQFLRYESL